LEAVLNRKTSFTQSEVLMEHTKLLYSKKAVQRAGEALIIKDIIKVDPDKYRESMLVLSNWRSSHVNALWKITEVLKNSCVKTEKNTVVVKRLKRTPSIISKLQRFDQMKLRNMQDIAGCRAILSTTKNVNKVKRDLNKSREFKVTDYIRSPKPDGYRGIHLITKFKDETNNIVYPVEIQLRSKVQHSWATAVEIVDLFTNQSLKSNEGKKDWLDFFKYISNEFSKIEDQNNEDIPNSLQQSIRLINKLEVHKKFQAFAGSLKLIEDQIEIDSDSYNLLEIDFNNKTISVHNYPLDDFSIAAEEYLKLEKKAAKESGLVVALVSSASINNLKEAYPNYFADSEVFIKNIQSIELENKLKNPSWFLKLLKSSGFSNDN